MSAHDGDQIALHEKDVIERLGYDNAVIEYYQACVQSHNDSAGE